MATRPDPMDINQQAKDEAAKVRAVIKTLMAKNDALGSSVDFSPEIEALNGVASVLDGLGQ